MSLDLNSSSVEYKGNKVVIKSIPKEGENLSVFMRPGDEVVFEIEGFDPETLEYILVGGDIVVSFTGEGLLTFPSLGLMGFSSNPPLFSFGGNKSISVDNILSKIEEVNELPITSVDASFKVTTSNKNEDEVPFGSKIDEAAQTQVIVVPQTQSFSDTQSKREDFSKTEQNSATSNFNSNSEPISNSTLVSSTYTNPYSQYTKPNDFDAYKPDVEMIPKPDYEFIPKPDVEMIPKPDEEMIPENDFTDYFPENDFDGYGDGDGDGDGDGPGEGVPSFGFKATAHQVRFSETTNDEGMVEILGGGGSINGYKFDSITNQFEPETIDMSTRSENMVIRAENSTYFNDKPSSVTGINTIAFKDLIAGQSITVDGLTLTASDVINAADVATAFASLSAGATAGNSVTGVGSWSGTLSTGWSSAAASATSVTFKSTEENSDISVFETSSAMVAPAALVVASTDGDASTTESNVITFQDLLAGQSVTVDGLKLAATQSMTGAEVAAVFASIISSSTVDAINTATTKGDVTGTVPTLWVSGVATGADVTFASTTPTSNVTNIVTSSSGSSIDVELASSQDKEDAYLSRVLRFEPNMPEGFYVDSFVIDGLPAGVVILDRDANVITDSTIRKESMIFKDELGKVIEYGSPDFLTSFKSLEFTMKYQSDIVNPFNLSITANYKIDAAYADSVTEPEQSFTNEYTFALKDITSASDYTYNKGEFSGGLDDGFILAKEPNYNIIKDGSGDSIIYGGTVKDIIYDGAGDDKIYLSAGDDLVYGGSGTNYIYGDTDNDSLDAKKYTGEDTVSYEEVQSFGTSEVELLRTEGVLPPEDGQKLSGSYEVIDPDDDTKTIPNSLDVEMLASHKGVYVDLDGVHVAELNIDVNRDGLFDANDKINAISKFANREGRFTYDDDGYAVSTTLGKTITFTSVTPNAEVADIAVVLSPALNIVSTQGAEDVQEKHELTFQDLSDGESVTVDGLILTANGGGISAADVAAGFANLYNSALTAGSTVTHGEWSGVKTTEWTSGVASGAVVTFTSETLAGDVGDIVVSSIETAVVAAPTQGVEAQTETHALTFKALEAGQLITVDGLTLTASGDISAADVAAGFADLAASSNGSTKSDGTTENRVTNGSWSGALTADWASGAVTTIATVTFTSQTEKTDVEDIVVQSAGADVTIAQGSSDIDTKQSEKATIVFKDLIDGQSLSVGGLTLTATGGDISAASVAAGFADLAALSDGSTKSDGTTANTVANGIWSGTLDSFSSGKLESGLSSIQSAGYDIYEDIENITGSQYNDTIYGNLTKDNTLKGLGGSDTIDGRGGDNKLYGGDGFDTLISGTGKDFIDGGADTDVVSYVNMDDGKAVTIRLDRPNGEEEDYAGYYVDANGDYVAKPVDDGSFVIKDKIINIEDVTGSKYNDTIYGSSSTNFINGGAGDDRIFAGGGYDFIDGGEGSDWITYKPSDYDANVANPNFMQTLQGITVDLNASDFVMVKETATGALIDLVKNVEKISATDGADVIYGSNSADEEFWGWGGDDTLYGRNGNDILHGGSGDDYIRPGMGVDYSDGGSGVDFLHLYDDALRSKSVQQIRLDESGTVQYSTDNGTSWSDGYLTPESHNNNTAYNSAIFDITKLSKADNIEGIYGSSGADHIIGNSKDNRFEGHNGEDDIYGMAGDDFIRGGNGKDIIYGGDGNDILYGDGDNDFIYGEAGNDTIYGHSVHNKNAINNDTIDGGTGNNTLNYNSSSYGFVLDMNTIVDGYATVDFSTSLPTSHAQNNTGNNHAFDDKIKDIQNIHGSRGGDTITGDLGANIINGWWGADTINGGGGNDILYGGVHVDKIYGGAGDDYINLDQYSDTDTRVHSQNGEYAYGGEGNDTIVSQGGRDYLYGDATDATDALARADLVGDGDDKFIVSTTPYALHGGGGYDIVTMTGNSDFRSIVITGIEELDIGSKYTRFNFNQFFNTTINEFSKIKGDDNSQLFVYGDGTSENFDISAMDFSEFSGNVIFTAGGGTDTLKMGGGVADVQSIKMTENYFSTFEKFDIAAGSTLNVHAYNNNSDTFSGHNKNFDNVAGEINFIGSNANDTFLANFEALLDGKLTIDGGSGSDMVDVRTTKINETLIFDKVDMFKNIERLEFDNISNTNSIELDASLMKDWLSTGTDTLVLDLSSNAQASKVTIKETKGDDMTGFEIGKTYDITLDDNSHFSMQVV